MVIENNGKTTQVKYYNNFFNRLMGFMFKKNFNYAICFPKCNSVHTFFMREKIDIIMTDKNYNIIYIYKNFKPWKIILPKKNIYYTFEIPINKLNFNIGDKINIKDK